MNIDYVNTTNLCVVRCTQHRKVSEKPSQNPRDGFSSFAIGDDNARLVVSFSTPGHCLLCQYRNGDAHIMDDTPVPSIRLPTDWAIQALPCFLLLPFFTRRNVLWCLIYVFSAHWIFHLDVFFYYYFCPVYQGNLLLLFKTFWTVTRYVDAVNVHAGNLFDTLFFNLLKYHINWGSWFGAFWDFLFLLKCLIIVVTFTIVRLITFQTQIWNAYISINFHATTVKDSCFYGSYWFMRELHLCKWLIPKVVKSSGKCYKLLLKIFICYNI